MESRRHKGRKNTKSEVRTLLRSLIDTAPNPRTVVAAREVLRTRAMTGGVSTDGKIIFGQVLNADRETYDVSVDLTVVAKGPPWTAIGSRLITPTLRCTCPSRQFPCKHEYALLLMFVEGPSAVCREEPLPPWMIQGRMDRRLKMQENKNMRRCPITNTLMRRSLEYFDASLNHLVQGEVKDGLEDMLLAPNIVGEPGVEKLLEVLQTRTFVTVLLTSKILLSRLSIGRPWGRGEETMGTMATKERILEEGLRHLTWEDTRHNHVRETLSDLLRQASDDRAVKTVTHQLGGRQDRDRKLLDVDAAERNIPVCDLALEIFAQATLLLDAPRDLTWSEGLGFFGELFAHLLEKSAVGWATRVQYIQVLLDIGPENYEQWRQMNEFNLNKFLQGMSSSKS